MYAFFGRGSDYINNYVDCGSYYIGTTKTGLKFYFDKKYYNIVSLYHWKMNSDHIPVTCVDNKYVSIKKILFGNISLKHINGNKSDIREKNLIPTRGLKHDGKTFLNGYISIYMPEHKRAFDNGCVYEHVLVAEKMLNRELKETECVHHINHIRTDNRPENLMVFHTNKDHILFHAGNYAILLDDGSYVVDDKKIEYLYKYNNRTAEEIKNNVEDKGSVTVITYKRQIGKDLCPVCLKNMKSIKAKMCKECWDKEKSTNIPTKEELEKYIYDVSFEKIGKMYGVTGKNITKWCKKYNLPYRKKDMDKKLKERYSWNV